MATKLKENNTTSVLKQTKETRQHQNAKKESEKTASKKSLRIDMFPEGYDLDEYLIKATSRASIERGMKVTKTSYIQELIIKDMEEHKTDSSYRITKRDKVRLILEKLDDKEIAALATLFHVQ